MTCQLTQQTAKTSQNNTHSNLWIQSTWAPKCDIIQATQRWFVLELSYIDFLNNLNDWNILSKVNDATNNRANTTETNIVIQEHQDYYDWWDQQYIVNKYNGGLEQVTLDTPAIDILNQEHQDSYNQQDQQYIGCKYDGGLEQITLELVLDIILKEEEDGCHQWSDQYDQCDNILYTPVEEDDVEGSHTFNVDNHVYKITKIKWDGTSKTRAVSELSESNNKSDFISAKVNHKYGTFEANY